MNVYFDKEQFPLSMNSNISRSTSITWSFCFFLAMANALWASNPRFIPSDFSANITFALDSSYEVKWEKGKLVYTVTESDGRSKTIGIVPRGSDWREFRQALDRSEVWEWHRWYETPSDVIAVDGTGWSFTVSYDDKSIRTSGTNCYPDNHGKPALSMTPRFRRMLRAIGKLLQGRTFGTS